MSVPKSRRGESPADYLDLAREIYVFTYDRVKILPKSHTFYFSLPLYNAAQRAYRLVKTANLVYIDEKAPKVFRRWVDSGRMAKEDVDTSVTSFRGHMRRFNDYFAVQTVEREYRELFAA